MSLPGWLPPLFSVDPWTEKTFDQLYEVFRRDFLREPPQYRGSRVWVFPEKEDGKEKVFWHITTRDEKDIAYADRLPDPRRCERLPWGRPVILQCPDPGEELLDWDYEEGDGKIKTYAWLKKHDFAVIMKKYPDGRRRLITMFFVDFPNKKRDLQRKFDERIK